MKRGDGLQGEMAQGRRNPDFAKPFLAGDGPLFFVGFRLWEIGVCEEFLEGYGLTIKTFLLSLLLRILFRRDLPSLLWRFSARSGLEVCPVELQLSKGILLKSHARIVPPGLFWYAIGPPSNSITIITAINLEPHGIIAIPLLAVSPYRMLVIPTPSVG